ncbi:MAG: glucosaminidase domain-containing protein [Patescibacteria group bacterium]|nr:glucosaminidase domain-containing protein [Patescibacteria group bacterium]
MLNTFKNIVSKINISTTQFVFVGFLMVLVPFSASSAQKPQYETRIQFNQNNVQPLALADKKVEVYSAGSREDVNNLNPESIKGLMQAIAPQYGVDWKLVYAIGYHESGNYSSSLARRQNNFFGRKAASGGYASWATPEEGIRNEFTYLKERYLDKGLTTPASINRVYAEDQSWHFAVESVMASL